MESLRRTSTASVSSDHLLPLDASFARPEGDSLAESQQQCSADPSAFLGFHVPPSAEEVDVQPVVKQKKPTLKLVLDLESTTGGVTRGGDGFRPVKVSNPFSELFAGDTQDDEDIEMQATEQHVTEASVVEKRQIQEDRSNRSPPPNSLDKEWRRTKESEEAKTEEDSLPGASAFSDYSEDLAPRVFHTLAQTEKLSSIEEKERKTVAGDNERFGVTGDSDRETDYEDELECTQPLEEEEELDHPGSHDLAAGDEEEETEVFPASDTGTLPYESTTPPDNGDKNGERIADGSRRSGDSHAEPRQRHKNDQQSGEDEVTSREGSQATQQDYLTPRVIPSRAAKPDAADTRTEPVVVVVPSDTADQNSRTFQDEDDQDECVSTQPSKRAEREPVVEPTSPSQPNVLKPNDEAVASKQASDTDSQAKAIRTLEFSFLMPESQEGEPHFSASLSSNGTPAAKRLESFARTDKPSPFESSISPVWAPTATPIPTPVDDHVAPDVAPATQEARESSKRKAARSGLPTGTKKQKVSSEACESPGQTTSTPKAKKRRRGMLSPDGSVSSRESDGELLTPRPLARRGTRSSQSTPSSTPTIRMRTRTLTPVPSQRAYASRSRTLFKYKFEFCLTGFVKTGEENLKELIEGHGGRIPERYQEVLYKNNPKAVVIATPVSWRKRKFMQAVACGIPVVHTDWLKDCVEAGHVIPFEGYQVPTGYSVTTRKFECFPPRELNIFEGYSFGIVSDVAQTSKAEAKDKAHLMAFILKACGADVVYENLSSKSGIDVDVVLCDEYTQTCRYYQKKRHVPVKDFQWVTECMILQRLLDPEEPIFEPQRVGSEDVFAASAEIGDSDNTTLKLHTGELVMADISGSAADHYLLFNVCEILSIHVSGRRDEGSQSKRKDGKASRVMLRVGMLKREPYNPELSKTPAKVLDISSSQVKRRVVAISKEDYSTLKYKDESIFYYLEDEKETEKPAGAEHKWLTQ